MDARNTEVLRGGREGRAVSCVNATAKNALIVFAWGVLALGCVRFDDSAVGGTGLDAAMAPAVARTDAGAGFVQRSPDAAPVARSRPPVAVDAAGSEDAAPPPIGMPGVPRPGDGGDVASPVDAPAAVDGPAAAVDAPEAPDASTSAPDVRTPPPEVSPPIPPVSDLVAHWLFDEGRGTSAADATGKGSTATLHNGAGWDMMGVTGTALALDGENDYAEARPVAVPALQAPKSVAFFLSRAVRAGSDAGEQTCVALTNAAADMGLQIGIDRGRAAFWQWGQNEWFATAPALLAAGWHHIAYTYDGSQHRLFVDGIPAVASLRAPQRGPVTAVLIGTYNVADIPQVMCRGQVDDLRLYSRALTELEVAQLAKH